MRLFKFFIFLIFFSSCYSQLPLQDIKEQKEIVIPDPLNLKANWYDYFEVDEVELENREKDFLKRLQNIKTSFYTDDINKLINRIKNNFSILLNLKKKIKTTTYIKKEFLKKYSLKDVTNLGETLFQKEKDYQEFKKQIGLEELLIKSNEKEVDKITISYFKEPPSSKKRLLKGLELINEKLLLEIDRVQLEHLFIRLEDQNKALNSLRKEIDFARLNIFIDPTKKKELNQKKEELESDIQKYQDEMQVSRIALAESHDDDKAINLEKQKLLSSTLMFFYSKAALIKIEIEEAISDVEILKKIKNIQFYYEKIKKSQNDLKAIKNEVDLWKETVRFGLEKSLAKKADIQAKEIHKRAIDISEKSYSVIQNIEKEIFISDFLLEQLTLILKEKYATFKDKIALFWYKTKLFFKRKLPWFEEPIFKIGKSPVTPIGILEFFFIIFISYFLAALVRKYIKKIGLKNRKISSAAFYTLARLIFYVILFLGILIAFITLGVDFTAFAIVVGALGIGIGFGLQSIFSNFISGIILLLEKNIRVGDFIELETKEMGFVKEINVRTTLIRTLDNLEILIPNIDLVGKKFTNWTLSEKIRRVRIPFGVAFGSDKEFVKKVIIDAAKKVPTTIKEKPIDIWLTNIGESSLDFELIVWVNEYVKDIPIIATRSRYLWAIESALVKNNIEIPYPVRDVKLTKK